MSEPYYTDSVSDKLTGEDDLDELEKTGKGILTGNVSEERPAWLGSSKRYYCGNCRQGRHNTPENEERCRRKGCDCRCRTHYVGRDGKARPYGVQDDSFQTPDEPRMDSRFDSFIEELNEQYRRLQNNVTKEDTKTV